MSDVFEGPGWWLASDGKWYPPHLHQDESYRAAHATPSERDDPESQSRDVQSTAMPAPSVVTVSESSSTDNDVGESSPTDNDVGESSPPTKRPGAGASASTVNERAEKLRRRAQADRVAVEEEATESDLDTVPREPSGRARLEVAEGHDDPRTRSVLDETEAQRPAIGMRDESRVVSTDVVPVPRVEPLGLEPVDLYDRVVASVLFLSGVAMIVGTFMAWEVGPRTSSTGWELGDGLATVVAGVVGSAAAGPIFVGYRHVLPKTLAIVAGLVTTVVVGLSGLQAVSDSSAANTTVGAGFWVVGISGVAMLAAGLADRSPLG